MDPLPTPRIWCESCTIADNKDHTEDIYFQWMTTDINNRLVCLLDTWAGTKLLQCMDPNERFHTPGVNNEGPLNPMLIHEFLGNMATAMTAGTHQSNVGDMFVGIVSNSTNFWFANRFDMACFATVIAFCITEFILLPWMQTNDKYRMNYFSLFAIFEYPRVLFS